MNYWNDRAGWMEDETRKMMRYVHPRADREECEWTARRLAAKFWAEENDAVAATMNLSMIPHSAKFMIERGLPVGANVLRMGRVS